MGDRFETDLSDYEKSTVLPVVTAILSFSIGRDSAVSAASIGAMLKAQGLKGEGALVRKTINYIRSNELVPRLIANSRGYYVATSKKEMAAYVQKLAERAASIMVVARKLELQLENWDG